MVKTPSPLCVPLWATRICVATNGVVRFSVCGSIWMPHTFYLMEENKMNQQYQKPPKWFIIGVIVFFSAAIIFFISSLSKMSNRASSSGTSSSKDQFGHSEAYAKFTAEDIVKRELKSPSTAKFCSTRDATITRSGNTWTVSGWVDAQNSFGATIRNNFTVKFTFTQGDSYTVDSCSIR